MRDFVAEHAGLPEFADEVELLRPVLDGAGILYVVDASSHLEPANEDVRLPFQAVWNARARSETRPEPFGGLAGWHSGWLAF